jgi:hypothetical protein
MSADPVADQGADVFDPPGRDPWPEFDRARKGARLHLPPQRRGGKWEDRWNQLGLADVARFGQRADRMRIVWHVAVLHEARLRVMECTQLNPTGRNCGNPFRNCGKVLGVGLAR